MSRVLAALMHLREAFLRIYMSSNLYKVDNLQIVAMYKKVDDEMKLQSSVSANHSQVDQKTVLCTFT